MGILDFLTSPEFNNFTGALQAIGDQNMQRQQQKQMQKVYAANPEFAANLYNTQISQDRSRQQQQLIDSQMAEEQRKLQQQQALKDLAPTLSGKPINEALAQYAQITGDPTALFNYQQAQQITPYQQAQLNLERQRLAASDSSLPKTTGLPAGQMWAQGPNGPMAVPIQGAITEQQKEAVSQAKGAEEFLRKIADLEKAVVKTGNLVGPIEGSDLYRASVGLISPNKESQRQLLDQSIANAELDVANMKLKGTGPITDSERKIARGTLPSTRDVNSKTSLKKLESLKEEAIRKIEIVDPNRAAAIRTQLEKSTPAGEKVINWEDLP